MPNFLRPKSRFTRFIAGELPFELVLAIGASVVGVLTGIKYLNDTPPSNNLAIISFVCTGIVGGTYLLRAIFRNVKANQETELHALDGVLHTLHAILTANKESDHGFRLCVFVPKPNDGEMVHQLTDYVGPENRTGHGRDLSSRCGIVGMAFRTGDAQFDKLQNGTHITDHLVNRYAFDRGEAGGMKQDCRSWAAVPIGEPNRVVAVVYMDSTQRDFFGSINSQVRSTIEAATLGIAKFVAET